MILAAAPLISIVDDDRSVRKSLQRLIKSVGLRVEAFASAEDFLQSGHYQETACLILDIRLPGMSGLELQRQLATSGRVSIIFVSAHDDPEVRAETLGAGAIAFLGKPFSDKALLDAVQSTLKPRRKGF